jgi:UDP-N-acetylglucosamine:LPS N-acetylglucosamine transferase
LEAAVYKKPVVLVPNPEWTLMAGMEDARYLAKKLNAVLVSEIKTETLLDAINEAKSRKIPDLLDGAQNLANEIMKLAQ